MLTIRGRLAEITEQLHLAFAATTFGNKWTAVEQNELRFKKIISNFLYSNDVLVPNYAKSAKKIGDYFFSIQPIRFYSSLYNVFFSIFTFEISIV